MFEGVPNYPDPSRFWQVVDKHNVSIFYTAPTAIRALMREGEDYVRKTSRNSLRLLGTVGEPINPEAWMWYYEQVGEERCPIVDTWWQTETGGILITPLPGATPLKPGSATRPFFGVEPVIVDGDGSRLDGRRARAIFAWRARGRGRCAPCSATTSASSRPISRPSRGSISPATGRAATQDGFYWITGRVDDVINVAGHRLGTAEIESALVAHPKVAEAAVVGYPHDIKGQGIYAYVTLARRPGAERGVAQRAGAMGAQGDQPDRRARPRAMGARPAQDPLRQDHAPHLAARSPPTSTTTSATPRPWPTRRSSTTSSTTG